MEITELENGRMLYGRMMAPVNGCMIEKTAELHSVTGKIIRETVAYTVYVMDGDCEGIVNVYRTLAEARSCARSYH